MTIVAGVVVLVTAAISINFAKFLARSEPRWVNFLRWPRMTLEEREETHLMVGRLSVLIGVPLILVGIGRLLFS